MNKLLLASLAIWGSLNAMASDVLVQSVKCAGPVVLSQPFMVDSVDVNSKPYSADWVAEENVRLSDVFASTSAVLTARAGQIVMPKATANSVYVLGFAVKSLHYQTISLSIEGIKSHMLYVDGQKADASKIVLEPGMHAFSVKLLATGGEKVGLKLNVDNPELVEVALTPSERTLQLSDVLNGKRGSGVQLSPDGRYLLTEYSNTLPGGKVEYSSAIRELSTGRIVAEGNESWAWMPRSNRYYYKNKGQNGNQLVVVNPENGQSEVLADQLPEGRYVISPTEDYLILMGRQEGPKERADIYEIVEPNDRQPGWRNRSYLAKYDFKTHTLQRLTYGWRSVRLNDISSDGEQMLFSVGQSRLAQRPTSVSSFYSMNLKTMKVEQLVFEDGFLGSAQFSPDGRKVLFMGSPESLNGIGKNVRSGQVPNMYDYQLYVMNVADKKVVPVTKNFDPCIENVQWSLADGNIYFSAQHKDSICMYVMNPESYAIHRIEVPEDVVPNWSAAASAPMLAMLGHSASNSDRIYTYDIKRASCTLVEDLSKEILKDVKLGECLPWNFVNSRGDTINGRYYLPANFDPNRKYPVIVNYYGGCSPTERNFESRYPHHVYAGMGYVVYVINPSGATGFGQEFSARHVNTAGKGVAEDIIEGTKRFLAEHSFTNPQKVGCIGASYGGFMTQYLQTQTDIFAAAISHAGISDHTSYWGEGYWGYSYSEVSMANSYPWTRKDLFVDQSPLFNADKVHTPLLFLHGSADTNVPIGESIQMFTALKLLGRPTAFVVVDKQDHHIVDYDKRIRWQNTIFAWFQKHLQDDDAWWSTLYPHKNL